MDYFKIKKLDTDKYEFILTNYPIKTTVPISKHGIKSLINLLSSTIADNEHEVDGKLRISKEQITLLANLSDKDTQSWLREISSENLIVVVKFSQHLEMNEFYHKVLHNMTKRAGDMLREDIEMKNGTTIDNAWDRLKEIFTIADRMSQCGEINLYDDSSFIG